MSWLWAKGRGGLDGLFILSYQIAQTVSSMPAVAGVVMEYLPLLCYPCDRNAQGRKRPVRLNVSQVFYADQARL